MTVVYNVRIKHSVNETAWYAETPFTIMRLPTDALAGV